MLKLYSAFLEHPQKPSFALLSSAEMSPRSSEADPLSVSFVLADLKGGGAERMTLRLASGLAVQGIKTELVVFSRSGELVAEVPDYLKVTDLGTKRSSRSIGALVRHFRTSKPAVAFTTLHHTSITVRLALMLAATQTRLVIRIANHIGEIRASRSWFSSRVLESMLHWTYRGANLLTTVSQDLTKELGKFLGGSGPKIVTHYNPVIDARFLEIAGRPAKHSWLQQPRTGPVIVTAGRLAPQKDHASLIKAFKLVNDIRPARLIIFGDGPEREALTNLAETLGIADSVDLPGFDNELAASLAQADLFALSSKWEGLPGVLIQALALGIPVVSTDCPTGPAEILEEGRWGRLVPVGDHVALAEAMLDALANPKEQAPEVSTERFQAQSAIETLIADLRKMLE